MARPGFEEQAPYTVALVKLAEGPVVTAQLTDLGEHQGRDRHAGRDGHPQDPPGWRRARHDRVWV